MAAERARSSVEVRVLPDFVALAEVAAELFIKLANAAVAAHGRFSVALSGGQTPRTLFVLLASKRYRGRIDWSKLELFWSDERAVPPDDPESNYRMAREALLDFAPVPATRIHRMPAERRPLEAAADDYASEIRRTLGAGSDDTPRFDLIMLGLGPDGHTASLIPETRALDEQSRIVVPNHVPRLGADRLTFTARLINAAANLLFLVAGADKADALAAVLDGGGQPRRYPAQLVHPEDGHVYWLVDAVAASKLNPERWSL